MAVTRMVRLSLVLAAGALAVVWQSSASAAQAQNRQLKLVSTAWSPFTNAPGQPRFALDLVESALGRINITATTTIVEASRFTPSLLGSDFDGISGMVPQGLEDVSKFPALVRGLIDLGYADADIRKIMGENLLRVMKRNEEVAGGRT